METEKTPTNHFPGPPSGEKIRGGGMREAFRPGQLATESAIEKGVGKLDCFVFDWNTCDLGVKLSRCRAL